MQMDKKINFYNSLFMSILFSAIFTAAGGLILSGAIDWQNFIAEAAFGCAVGLVISMILPLGKWGAALAGKVAKPGSFLFKLIMYAVLIAILVALMCPILTLFIGLVILGAPIRALLPTLYSLYIPFFIIALVIALLIGDIILKLSMKCASLSGADSKKSLDP
jgi:hypothetical protein